MSGYQDSFRREEEQRELRERVDNIGRRVAVGDLVAMFQRDKIIAQQQEQAQAQQGHHRRLEEAASERNRLEHERLQIEQQRLDLAVAEKRAQEDRLERERTIKNFLAETLVAFERLRRRYP